jgi:hypothetical protein
MSTDCPKRGSRSLEKATVSNMWEIAAIVEVQRVAKGTTH